MIFKDNWKTKKNREFMKMNLINMKMNMLRSNTIRMRKIIKIKFFKRSKKCKSIWMILWDRKMQKD